MRNKREPFAPLKTRPTFNPKQFDPLQQVFIPDLAVTDPKVSTLSPRKMRLIGAKVYLEAAQTIPDTLGTWTQLTYDTEAFDQGEMFNVASDGHLEIPYTGIYSVAGFVTFEQDPTGQRFLRLRVDSATRLVTMSSAINTADTPLALSTPLLLEAGSNVSLEVDQNSGGDLDVRGGENDMFLSAVFMGSI